jgi:cell division protein FtsB
MFHSAIFDEILLQTKLIVIHLKIHHNKYRNEKQLFLFLSLILSQFKLLVWHSAGVFAL